MSDILTTAVSGLNDSILRIANAASNIVNASSIGSLPAASGDSSGAFAPQDVVTISNSVGNNNLGVSSTLTPRNPSYVTVSDPSSAFANAQGLVAAPNVDLNAELISSKVAEVNYGADATVIKVDEKMQQALLDITT